MSRWLEFVEIQSAGRTRRWDVLAKTRTVMGSGGAGRLKLGEIVWYSPWRQYTFFPQPETLFNAECLRDVTQFLADHRDDRRAAVL